MRALGLLASIVAWRRIRLAGNSVKGIIWLKEGRSAGKNVIGKTGSLRRQLGENMDCKRFAVKVGEADD
jgi:hypothetical protein